MTQLGEIKKGFEIGKEGYYPQHKRYIFSACIDCGKERWEILKYGKPERERCLSCANRKNQLGRVGSRSAGWKGGKIKTSNGYIQIKVLSNDFFYPMADKNGYVLEHRLVVAKALGRNLHSWEIVHHKGAKYPLGSMENKQDNRYPENLELTMQLSHKGKHQMLLRIEQLEKRVTLLEAENIALREQLNLSEVGYAK